jgi:anti-sigma B factor antagonist
MDSSRADTDTERVLAVAGDVGAPDAKRLRTDLFRALDDGESDVLLDISNVTAFDDAVFAVLVAARSRAKARRRRIVLVDDEAGLVTRSLHRTGLMHRFPVYADVGAATAGLSADRDARTRLFTGSARPPAPRAAS